MANKPTPIVDKFREFIGKEFIHITESGVTRQRFKLYDITDDGKIIFEESTAAMNWESIGGTVEILPELLGETWIEVDSILNSTESKMSDWKGKTIHRTKTMAIPMSDGGCCYDVGFVDNISILIGATERVMAVIRRDLPGPHLPVFLSGDWLKDWELAE